MQNTQQIRESRRYEPAKYEYKKSSFADIFDVLQSLRKDEVFCDVKLETDDNQVIFAHKVVLASASPYFHAMFTNVAERNHGLVVMRPLDSTTLKLLVNFIYSGEITITEKNVEVLLPAASLLQLQEVKEACCDFLQFQLCNINCFGINTLADLHGCTQLLTSTELYIQQHFSEVVDGDEFLFLSSDQVVKLISSDELIVPSEEKVFESVIRWINHEVDSRKCILPQLMEHVRLPLASRDYIFKNVVEEPLIKNCFKCKDYIIEALHFHFLTPDELIPQNIRTKPRLGDRVILMVSGYDTESSKSTEWYDPKMNLWHFGPEMITHRGRAGVAVVDDNLVFSVGGYNDDGSSLRYVDVLDLSSITPCWKPTVDMLVEREMLGVGVINNNLYAVGGFNDMGCLNSAEVFDCNIQSWSMISSMSTRRADFGVGVLNDLLYAVGGCDISFALNTVEYYTPDLNTWEPVEKMCEFRSGVGIGVLDGVLYAVGGHDGLKYHRSVEVYSPSTGIWTFIADMHLCRRLPGVVALDGLLYVVGGHDGTSVLDSVECYNPKTMTWTMVTRSINVPRTGAGVVVIERPRNLKKLLRALLQGNAKNSRKILFGAREYGTRNDVRVLGDAIRS